MDIYVTLACCAPVTKTSFSSTSMTHLVFVEATSKVMPAVSCSRSAAQHRNVTKKIGCIVMLAELSSQRSSVSV